MSQWISVREARQASSVGGEREVRGWVRTRRDSKGGFSFLELNDGSCFGNLQVVVLEIENYTTEVQRLTAGCSVVVLGDLQESPVKGQATELHATCKGDRLGRSRELPTSENGIPLKLREWDICVPAPIRLVRQGCGTRSVNPSISFIMRKVSTTAILR